MTWRAKPHWLDPQVQKLVLNDPHCTVLRLGTNRQVDDADVEKLAQAMDGNTKLRELNLRGCQVSPKPVSLLASVLANRTGLESLNLTMNCAGDPGAQYMADALRRNSTLTELHLAMNGITENGTAALGIALKANRTLLHLNLGNNVIANGARFFAEVLEHDTPLEELILNSCSMEAEGLVRLANALPANHVLRKLDLNSNKIGDDGAEKFAEALTRNHTLQELDLGQAELGNRGASQLARSLAGNKGLTHLRLSCNLIGTEGAECFSESVMKFNTTIREIALGCNPISNDAFGRLEDVLDRNVAEFEGRAPRRQDLINDPRRDKSRALNQEPIKQPEVLETEKRSYVRNHVRNTFGGGTSFQLADDDDLQSEKPKVQDKLVAEILTDLGIISDGNTANPQDPSPDESSARHESPLGNEQACTPPPSAQDGEPPSRDSLISDILAELGANRPAREAKPKKSVRKSR